jgi:hypothetical protein
MGVPGLFLVDGYNITHFINKGVQTNYLMLTVVSGVRIATLVISIIPKKTK